MKNTRLFYILFCTISTLMISACEKAEIQGSTEPLKSINQRADDCSNCPPADCCCKVALNGTSNAALTFCGTTNPELSTTTCSADLQSPCPDVSGYIWTTNLSSTSNPDEFFCVAKNTSFMLGVGTSPANLTLTCQYGQFGAQVLNLSLSANEKLYFNADGSCSLSSCHPDP
jgi:hypothetical protein